MELTFRLKLVSTTVFIETSHPTIGQEIVENLRKTGVSYRVAQRQFGEFESNALQPPGDKSVRPLSSFEIRELSLNAVPVFRWLRGALARAGWKQDQVILVEGGEVIFFTKTADNLD